MLSREKVHVEIDDSTIANGNPAAVIEPVWWLANIYDGPVAYERSLQQFSRSQRLVFAMLWHIAEVNNGGHHQFYSNSTGIVWSDALAGFETIGAAKAARIVAISADRMGGKPARDHEQRYQQLVSQSPEFDDLDEAFYKPENIDLAMMSFIRSRPSDFYFSGIVERIVLPRS